MSGQQTRSRWPDSAVIFVVPASEDADRNRAVGTEVNVVSPNSLRRLEGMTARGLCAPAYSGDISKPLFFNPITKM